MPIYEYQCDDCGAQFDSLRSMREADSPIACQECGGLHTHRKISVFYAQADGRSIASSSSSCSGCSGGTCSGCNH